VERIPLAFEQLTVRAYDLWENQWLLLTSGDFRAKDFNTMTIAWGSLGCMWKRPFVQVVVRPCRYTYTFLERYPSFTVCAFPRRHRSALELLGTRSGRDGDKIADAGLTPIASERIEAPGFAEAELILECRKIYFDDFDPDRFLDPRIEGNYPKKDYHRIYFGEILGIRADQSYQAAR